MVERLQRITDRLLEYADRLEDFKAKQQLQEIANSLNKIKTNGKK